MCSKLETWKGLKSLFGKWCHAAFFIVNLAGSAGVYVACLAPPGLSQLLSKGHLCSWVEMCPLTCGWQNHHWIQDVVTKVTMISAQHLRSWCSKCTGKVMVSQRLKWSICWKGICLQITDGKYRVSKSYPTSTHPAAARGAEPLNQGAHNFSIVRHVPWYSLPFWTAAHDFM